MYIKKMLTEIADMLESDFAFEMVGRTGDYTQKEALGMANLIGDIYTVAHCIHCKACGRRYE